MLLGNFHWRTTWSFDSNRLHFNTTKTRETVVVVRRPRPHLEPVTWMLCAGADCIPSEGWRPGWGGQHREEGRLTSGETGEEGGLCCGHGAGQPDNCGRAMDAEQAPVNHGQSTAQHQLHTYTLMYSFCKNVFLLFSAFLLVFNA